jgi:heme-degrading monooxygenase HmoA
MTAYNVVRFRVKPGREKDFVEANRAMGREKIGGFRRGALVKTGDRTYCLVGEWDNFDAIVAARSTMIASLDGMRDMLEDLGGSLGVTDPVSGEAVLEI